MTATPNFRTKDFVVDSITDIDYRESPYENASERLDLFFPTETVAGGVPITAGPLPLILYVHGGSFYLGTKGNTECGLFAQAFASRGFLVAPIDYKMLGSYTYQTSEILATKSVRAAVRWAMATDITSYGLDVSIDTSKIIVAGDSAGATAAVFSMITNYEDTDGFTTYNGTRAQACLALWPATQSVGFPLNANPILANIQAGYADKVLSLHGSADTTNYLSETLALAYMVGTASGLGRMHYKVLQNAGHTAWNGTASSQGFYPDGEDLVAFQFREWFGL